MKQFIITATILLSINFTNAQTNKSIPRVYMTKSITKLENGNDARNLSNDEVNINLIINDLIIDTFTDFGSGEYSKEDMSFYLQSEMSQKTYIISILNESQMSLSYILLFDGEEREVWNKTYSINIDHKWSKLKCEGDCK